MYVCGLIYACVCVMQVGGLRDGLKAAKEELERSKRAKEKLIQAKQLANDEVLHLCM